MEEWQEDLDDDYNDWLDAMMEVYGEILEEWENHEYVKPHPAAKATFACNNCGKCCDFTDHWVWVYPSDMVKWLQKIDEERHIPLFLSALFPIQDMDGVSGYGLPSQKDLIEGYQEILRENKQNKDIQATLGAIQRVLKKINPGFSPSSPYCIYYNPDNTATGHCMIYSHRPIQCRTYPFDFPQFTKFEIPGLIDEEDLTDVPMCPPETFTNGTPQDFVKATEEELENVTIEKANYRMTALVDAWAKESEDWKAVVETDICDLLLEIFHLDVINLEREGIQVTCKTEQGDKIQHYVAGARPKGKPSHKGGKKRNH